MKITEEYQTISMSNTGHQYLKPVRKSIADDLLYQTIKEDASARSNKSANSFFEQERKSRSKRNSTVLQTIIEQEQKLKLQVHQLEIKQALVKLKEDQPN